MRIKQTLANAFVILLALTMISLTGLSMHSTAWAARSGEDFASQWQPRPLVDTNPDTNPAMNPNPASAQSGTSQTEALQPPPDVEKLLKPVEPFIRDIEAHLYISPKSGEPLLKRLNTLQVVLFGEAKFQDAGELLAKLSELFPAEAQKTHAQLMLQMHEDMPQALPETSPGRTASAGKAAVKTYPDNYPSSAGQYRQQAATYPQPSSPTALRNAPEPAPPQQPRKKRRFWQSDDDFYDFKNDSFFNDNPDPAPSGGESGLRSLSRGLAGLAMMAGSVAGSYYLNKRMGNNTDLVPNNGIYNQPPYPYGAYGQLPPGYVYPYGMNGMTNPYGLQQIPGQTIPGTYAYQYPYAYNGLNASPYNTPIQLF